MRNFHGAKKTRGYFEGWYFKQQNGTDVVALIPSFHVDRTGRRSASLQAITNDQSFSVPFPAEEFRASEGRFCVRLGRSVFTRGGCQLDCETEELKLKGQLQYGPFTPPETDVMGPFRFVPGMQCRHSVFSLYHRVDGWLSVNGKKTVFQRGTGYMEGDRGRSFPRRYVWTQGSADGGCVMLSIADIPVGGRSFTGCIACILWEGKEYRLATYTGVELLHIGKRLLMVKQGDLLLTVQLLKDCPLPLQAPQGGAMGRTIHESGACLVRYRLLRGSRVVFDFTSGNAGFESEWEDAYEPSAT